MAIDLAYRFPSASEIEALAKDGANRFAYLDAFLASGGGARALADLHPRMWGLDPDHLPELDRLADGDTALAAQLTDAMRQTIVEEPALVVRNVLARKRPFAEIFSAPFTIVAADTMNFWGLTDDGAAWAGEPYHFATYPDARPAAGVLASNAFRTGFATRQDPTLRVRTSRMLDAVTCLKTENPTAHLFNDLVAEDYAQDLSELARTRKTCTGCHAHFAEIAPAFAGFALAGTFDDLKEYTTAANDVTGKYSGHPFTGLAELGRFVGNDPRTHRCEVRNLLGAIYQRSLSSSDETAIALALNRFYAGNLDLTAVARTIYLTAEYSYGTPLYTKQDNMRSSSGIRFLKPEQLRGLLTELTPAAAGLLYPPALNPGHDELLGGEAFIPTGGYYHALQHVARQAASLIVRDELRDGATAASRRVLTALADGDGTASTQTAINGQIKELWRKLTTEELADSSQLFIDYLTLWTEAKPESGPEAFRNAWGAMLLAMLTHPTFVSY